MSTVPLEILPAVAAAAQLAGPPLNLLLQSPAAGTPRAASTAAISLVTDHCEPPLLTACTLNLIEFPSTLRPRVFTSNGLCPLRHSYLLNANSPPPPPPPPSPPAQEAVSIIAPAAAASVSGTLGAADTSSPANSSNSAAPLSSNIASTASRSCENGPEILPQSLALGDGCRKLCVHLGELCLLHSITARWVFADPPGEAACPSTTAEPDAHSPNRDATIGTFPSPIRPRGSGTQPFATMNKSPRRSRKVVAPFQQTSVDFSCYPRTASVAPLPENDPFASVFSLWNSRTVYHSNAKGAHAWEQVALSSSLFGEIEVKCSGTAGADSTGDFPAESNLGHASAAQKKSEDGAKVGACQKEKKAVSEAPPAGVFRACTLPPYNSKNRIVLYRVFGLGERVLVDIDALWRTLDVDVAPASVVFSVFGFRLVMTPADSHYRHHLAQIMWNLPQSGDARAWACELDSVCAQMSCSFQHFQQQAINAILASTDAAQRCRRSLAAGLRLLHACNNFEAAPLLAVALSEGARGGRRTSLSARKASFSATAGETLLVQHAGDFLHLICTHLLCPPYSALSSPSEFDVSTAVDTLTDIIKLFPYITSFPCRIFFRALLLAHGLCSSSSALAKLAKTADQMFDQLVKTLVGECVESTVDIFVEEACGFISRIEVPEETKSKLYQGLQSILQSDRKICGFSSDFILKMFNAVFEGAFVTLNNRN